MTEFEPTPALATLLQLMTPVVVNLSLTGQWTGARRILTSRWGASSLACPPPRAPQSQRKDGVVDANKG
jgi:hypothetical protein